MSRPRPRTLEEARAHVAEAETRLEECPEPRQAEWGNPGGIQEVDWTTGRVHTRRQYSARDRAGDVYRRATCAQAVDTAKKWLRAFMSDSPHIKRLETLDRQKESLQAQLKAVDEEIAQIENQVAPKPRPLTHPDRGVYICA